MKHTLQAFSRFREHCVGVEAAVQITWGLGILFGFICVFHFLIEIRSFHFLIEILWFHFLIEILLDI
jgi:hypothetical protein